MNKYKKFAWLFLFVEFILFAGFNAVYFVSAMNQSPSIERSEEAGNIVYRVTYNSGADAKIIILMEAVLGIMILLSAFLVFYIQKNVIKPFSSMTTLTEELAKGNLATPIKAEKSKFFGRFLWGMDMLRDNLEEKKEKELEMQKEKKTLILSLSHDIKTPLSAIELYSKALKEGLYSTEEKKAEAFAGIDKNIKQIKSYVSEIVEVSREDFLNLSVNMSEVYMSDVICQIEIYYGEKLRQLHTDFFIDKYTNCLLKGDKDRLIEVLQNIIENAIKYGDGKYINLNFYDEEDCRLIKITNSGNTLKDEEIGNIFDSFYRGSNTKNAKGSGLGLYICRQLMHLMSGEVFAESNEADFSITVVIPKA